MNKILNFLRTESLDLENMDWYNFMGFCDFHRLSGYLAGKLEKYNLPPQVKRHFGIQKEYQAYRQEHLFRAAKEIESALVRENIAHAFLKGTALSGTLYERGERGSNDIDILISSQDVGRAGKLLESLGFAQGLYRNGKLERFSRKEILSRRMNRGETAPYLKLTGDKLLPFIEIDLNFSLDWLPSSDIGAVDRFLRNTTLLENGLTGLTPSYCFMFLCMHLYKEATVLSMVQRSKDIELYKYLDIYKLFPQIDVPGFRALAEELGIEKECNYALYHTKRLFPEIGIGTEVPQELETVIDPENNNKRYFWTVEFLDRVEDTDRLRFLLEDCQPADGWKKRLFQRIAEVKYD